MDEQRPSNPSALLARIAQADVPPGHVAYETKAAMAAIAQRLLDEYGEALRGAYGTRLLRYHLRHPRTER